MSSVLCRLTPLVCLVLATLMALGCRAPASGTVSGKVTVNGKPLPSGLITFEVSTGKDRVFSAAIENGEYRTDNIPVGVAKVAVTPGFEAESREIVAKGGDLVAPPKATPAPKGPFEFDVKYQNTETSNLTCTVKSGENTFDVDLR